MSTLTTHVLDTMRGQPAAGMKIELWSLDKKALLKTVETNKDGRTDAPLLDGDSMAAGSYELIFFVGDYFGEKKFLDRVPVRFIISDANTKYHVPLLANDEFFAEKENLLRPGRGIFIPDKFTDRGKWMDGWETRRRRKPGNDWCVIQLGLRGVIKHVDIDTNHFLGNHPPFASLDAMSKTGTFPKSVAAIGRLSWKPVLKKSPLNPGSQN